jgi:hypothetical protein
VAKTAQAMDFARWFDQVGIDDVPLVVRENASLGEMYRKRKGGLAEQRHRRGSSRCPLCRPTGNIFLTCEGRHSGWTPAAAALPHVGTSNEVLALSLLLNDKNRPVFKEIES